MRNEMPIQDQYKDKYFFHFTHLDNLKDILINGLLSTNEKKAKKIIHLDVASPDIQCTRNQMAVPCGPKGKVHDYVPFYFCSRTPMFLSIIKSRNYDQPYFISFAVSFNKLKNKKFIFTNKAANRRFDPPEFYDCPTHLDELSWSIIESRSWSCANDSIKHKKMAEALHYGSFHISDVDYIVVWNEWFKDHVEKAFNEQGIKCPPIHFDGHNNYYHYYYDLNSSERNSSLVHGPIITKETFEAIVDQVNNRREVVNNHYKFDDIEDALHAVREDFSNIDELDGIVNLQTDNKVHSENVEAHTRRVVKNLIESSEYKKLNEREKLVVEFAAFLHDVGKGPKSRWPYGKQKVDDDHPRKSGEYIERILVEDINCLPKKLVRQIVLLVMYHDFFGDHLVSGRLLSEMIDILESESELNMLYALAKADVISIHKPWYTDKVSEWETAYETIMETFE
ncbi:DarT ssDNA thymidine ADP-ribosyltransferase family protein [Aeromonas media]|uniref:DarT ssDNA thymidine ADP-ribosyltransferase family protein n=1 Tax=Aeromonas media TaxID=651 RepID=UPI003CFFB897